MENLVVWDVLSSVETTEGASHAHLLALGSEGLDTLIAESVANGWLWRDEQDVYRMTDAGQAALDEHMLG
jgi:hypothetical protein